MPNPNKPHKQISLNGTALTRCQALTLLTLSRDKQHPRQGFLWIFPGLPLLPHTTGYSSVRMLLRLQLQLLQMLLMLLLLHLPSAGKSRFVVCTHSTSGVL